MRDSVECPKPAKPTRDPKYLRLVRQLDCIRCGRSDTEPHHPIMERHSQSKVSDDLAIPLCRDCHDLLHRRLSDWLVTMKPDYEYSAAVRKKVERMGWKP